MDPVTAAITVVPLDQSLPRLTYYPCPYAGDALLRGTLTDPFAVFLDGNLFLMFREDDLPPKQYTLDPYTYPALEVADVTREDAAAERSAMWTSSSVEPITISQIANAASGPGRSRGPRAFVGQPAGTRSANTVRGKQCSAKDPDQRILCLEPGCNQTLGRGSEANRHFWSKHSNKKLLCPLCFSIFSGKRPDAVGTHLKAVHKIDCSDQQEIQPLQGLLTGDGSRLVFSDRDGNRWAVATRLGAEGKRVMRIGKPKPIRGRDADSKSSNK
ncbi:hypothetical protein HWV62_17790 [Athelia sp. TMB]|nr:hypothetical protein HWV62_17790 [Athelia sp. TMB]